MSNPVAESIALELKSRIEAVTTANGYFYEVVEVYRPARRPQWSPRGGMIVLLQGDAQYNDDLSPQSNPPGIAWDQEFTLLGFIAADDTDETPVDALVNQAVADLIKGITIPAASWWTFDDNAVAASFTGVERVVPDGPLEAFTLNLTVTYRTDETNPYTVR